MKRNLSSLLLVCRQMSNDADVVFWSQPFRFTSDLGWVIYYYFLVKIGAAGRRKLKDITVCHPAFSVQPKLEPEYDLHSDSDNDDHDDTYGWDYKDVFDDHLWDFALRTGLEFPLSSICSEQSYVRYTDTFDRMVRYSSAISLQAWQYHDTSSGFEGTARLLAREAENLTKLTLVIPHFQRFEQESSFKDVDKHPIMDLTWSQGDQLSVKPLLILSTQSTTPRTPQR